MFVGLGRCVVLCGWGVHVCLWVWVGAPHECGWGWVRRTSVGVGGCKVWVWILVSMGVQVSE